MIPLTIPDIGKSDIERVVDVLRSGMLVQGKKVEELERQAAKLIGVEQAVAASSGTAALHLAARALGIGAGDEVIVPAFSFVATANSVELAGARPVFVDIDPRTFNIDTHRLPASITPRTKAIMPVHEFGLPCDIRRVMEIAAEHDLRVIEDAACAIGARSGEAHAGSFGDLAAFSLHPRKTITAGEGGLIACSTASLAEELRMLRNHGICANRDGMQFEAAGFNYRMTDIGAALAVGQFARLPHLLERRRRIAETYLDALSDCPFLQLPEPGAGSTHSWQTFHLILAPTINRERMIADLSDAGVGSNRGAQCIPEESYYQREYGFDCERLFPVALACARQGLAIPLYPKMSDGDVAYVISAVIQAASKQQ